MSNKHHQKFINKLLMGFILITGGILLIAYISFIKSHHDDWFIWAAGSVVLITAGLYFRGVAFTHKIKSDLIRKQRSKKHEETDQLSN